MDSGLLCIGLHAHNIEGLNFAPMSNADQKATDEKGDLPWEKIYRSINAPKLGAYCASTERMDAIHAVRQPTAVLQALYLKVLFSY